MLPAAPSLHLGVTQTQFVLATQVVVRQRDDTPIDEPTARRIDGSTADLGMATALALVVAGEPIQGGRVRLERDPESGQFLARAEYESPSPLSDADLEYLTRRTFGDWHDGIGGSFFEQLGGRLGVPVTVSVTGPLRAEQREAAPRLGPWSELVKACWRRQRDRVRELLDAGEDANARADGLPALLGAIAEGQEEIALLLIDRGADVHIRDLLEPRRDALRSCATSARLADDSAARIAHALRERGADPNRGDDPPLAIARRGGMEGLARVLAGAGEG